MTANKHLKRRVRERARRTGESYTAALRNLRQPTTQERTMDQHFSAADPGVDWHRFEVPEFGYAIDVPTDWQRREPDLRNSPWETARFGDPGDRRHVVIVFRSPAAPGKDATGVAERVQTSLAASLFTDFAIRQVPFAGRPGARLDCARHDAGRVWAVTQFLAVEGTSAFCLALGTIQKQEDETLFVAVADRFELLPDPDPRGS